MSNVLVFPLSFKPRIVMTLRNENYEKKKFAALLSFIAYTISLSFSYNYEISQYLVSFSRCFNLSKQHTNTLFMRKQQ